MLPFQRFVGFHRLPPCRRVRNKASHSKLSFYKQRLQRKVEVHAVIFRSAPTIHRCAARHADMKYEALARGGTMSRLQDLCEDLSIELRSGKSFDERLG